ncbi:hypothetical protein ACEQ8H_008427 [Pleosporales sp. CAS-2024a]
MSGHDAAPRKDNTGTNVPRPSKASQQHQRQTPPPPPPYLVNPPSAQTRAPRDASLVELYESIIASDAQTIQVQQQTMASQQDVIRSQSDMIMQLRHVLEQQDRIIDELDEAARGLRVRRPGPELAPRSRSS